MKKKDIKPILLRAKKDVYTNINGSNLSKLLGEGYDFVELQEYQPYSDIKTYLMDTLRQSLERYIQKQIGVRGKKEAKLIR